VPLKKNRKGNTTKVNHAHAQEEETSKSKNVER
jgi:hypothetical protein